MGDKSEEYEQHQLLLLKVAEERFQKAVAALEREENPNGALVYFQDALEIQESIRGQYHPAAVSSLQGVAVSLQSLGKHHKAKQHFHLAIQRHQTAARCSEGMRDAWIGLGEAFSNVETWHEAMKAFQSAARLQMYESLSEHEQERSQAVPQEEMSHSVSYLRKYVQWVERNSISNRELLWSHFPHLPKSTQTYLSALETTVRHELQGDLYFQQQQFAAAQREYQTALVVFREQVMQSCHGVSFDELWLLRKQALAQWWHAVVLSSNDRVMGDKGSEVLFPLNHLSLDLITVLEQRRGTGASGLCGNPNSVADFSRVCETMGQADLVLLTSTPNHQAQRSARTLYQRAGKLVELYQWVEQITFQETTSTSQQVLQDLTDLQEWLVPDGWAQKTLPPKTSAQQVWEELQRLSILVETTSATIPNPDMLGNTASSICQVIPSNLCTHAIRDNHGWEMPLVYFVFILLQFLVLPWFLSRIMANARYRNRTAPNRDASNAQERPKGTSPTTNSAETPTFGMGPRLATQQACHTTTTERNLVPQKSFVNKTSTPLWKNEHDASGTSPITSFLNALKRLDGVLFDQTNQAIEPSRSDEEFRANKVSAIIFLQKMRKELLEEDVEDEKFYDEDVFEDAMKGVANRMEDLGFSSLWEQALATGGCSCGKNK